MMLVPAVALASPGLQGCRELDRFSTNGDHFEGSVVAADFVRTGMNVGTTMCLTFDADKIQSGPGAFSTSDGAFSQANLRPIPQLWNDPLSSFTFGEGRLQNMMYVAHAAAVDGGAPADPLVFVSLLQSSDIEVRLVRGAPDTTSPGAGSIADSASAGASPPLFAVFPLSRKSGPCSY